MPDEEKKFGKSGRKTAFALLIKALFDGGLRKDYEKDFVNPNVKTDDPRKRKNPFRISVNFVGNRLVNGNFRLQIIG